MAKRILVVDDDPKIGSLLSDLLEENGFLVDVADNTEDAWDHVVATHPDLIVLDVEVPTKGGLQFCREVKEKRTYQKTPIIFLTVRDQEMDVVSALGLGGDDFITKPFRAKELLARINVTLRRFSYFQQTSAMNRSGTLFLDFDKRIVRVGMQEVKLTPKEFDLLKLLYVNRHRVLGDQEIFSQIWGAHCNSLRSTVYTHINQLRKKLKEHSRKIKTIPGTGFRFDERK